MKAIVQDSYGSADKLEFSDIDMPVPADDEVLIKVRAAGMEPGVWHLMTGLPYMIRLGFGLRKPKARVKGSDAAGVVEAVGSSVTRFRPGDEVFGIANGSFAEYSTAEEKKLVHKPGNLTFEQAAALPISGLTALQAVRDKGEVEPGQKVLVIGASGGVGSLAAQIAKAHGARVTGVCSTSKTDLVRSLGADEVIDYTREDFADGARNWDVIIDTGGRRSLSHLRRALAPRGILVLVGGEGGGKLMGGFGRQIFRAPLLSMFVGQKLRWFVSPERQEDLEALADMAEAGKLTPALDRTFQLPEAADAVRYWESGRARGKVVVTV